MYKTGSKGSGVQPIKQRTGRASAPQGSAPAANVAGKGSPGMGKGMNVMGHGERCATASHCMGKGE